MPDFLHIVGFETPRRRRNTAAHGWDDQDSHAVLVTAAGAAAALAWGDRVAQRFVAVLHDEPEGNWSDDGYASFIGTGAAPAVTPRVRAGESPDFGP